MFQIQVSKRRQKYVTVFAFDDRTVAQGWLKTIRCSKHERVRLIEAT